MGSNSAREHLSTKFYHRLLKISGCAALIESNVEQGREIITRASRTAFAFLLDGGPFTGQTRAGFKVAAGDTVVAGTATAVVQIPPLPVDVFLPTEDAGVFGTFGWLSCSSVITKSDW